MRSYNSYSDRKRSSKNKKIIYFLLGVALFFGFKIYSRRQAPAPTFAAPEQMNIPLPDLPKPTPQQKPAEDVITPRPLDLPKTPTNTKDNRKLKDLIEQVEASLKQEPKKIIEARNSLNGMLVHEMSDKQQGLIKQQLTALSNEWLFTRQVYAGDTLCELYEVQLGDLFQKIAGKCKVPYEFLMKINNISDPRHLRAGETIKIVNGPFNCRINRSTFTMDLYLQDTYVRSFVIGLGRPDMETPT
ncbi:MAG: LysM peptidoglycan-binding domain-containing protein, partial [Planctomycetota bacterium]